MRPRHKAAEYVLKGAMLLALWSASMRPRHKAAEYSMRASPGFSAGYAAVRERCSNSRIRHGRREADSISLLLKIRKKSTT